MATHELSPPTMTEIPDNKPLVFLAGPIQGAPLWQPRATDIIDSLITTDNDVYVANPRRAELDENFVYADQVAWEKAHLRRAAKHGAIIFWFAAQDPTQPYEAGRAYAQTSRIEFGRVLGWRDYNPDVQLALGVEPGYVGSHNYFKSCAIEQKLPLFTTIEDTCIEVVRNLK